MSQDRQGPEVDEPTTYVTEISVPAVDDGRQRLHNRMLPPEPLPDVEMDVEADLEAAI